MKGGEELLEVGVSVGWWMGGARGGPGCTFARGLRPGTGPRPPPCHSGGRWPQRGAAALWVPSDKGIDEWGGQHIRMTGIFHPVLLWPHVLSCSLWYYITFPKMVSIRMERERICRNVYLSTAHKFRTPWIESRTPQNESREEEARWGLVTGPRNAVPPQGHLAQIFLYQVISAQLPYGSPGLLCSFTVRFL